MTMKETITKTEEHTHITIGGWGLMFFIWLLSVATILSRPASFPQWVFDLCSIIFWIGVILLCIVGIVLVLVVIFLIIAN
jgi:hypothetical protein